MWIQNSSRYDDDEVADLVYFATQDVDLTDVCINIKNGRLGGSAYDGIPEISNAPSSAKYLITLRLGAITEKWPFGPINYHFKAPEEVGPRNRFPFFVCNDWREWLVKIAAHEAKHIEQYRKGSIRSEISCEHFSVAVLDRYRAKVSAPEAEQLTMFAA